MNATGVYKCISLNYTLSYLIGVVGQLQDKAASTTPCFRSSPKCRDIHIGATRTLENAVPYNPERGGEEGLGTSIYF